MLFKNPLRSSIQHRDGIPILPGAFPLVGHVPMMLQDMLGTLREARDTVGPLFWARGLGSEWILLWTEKESFELLKNKVTSSEHQKELNAVLVGDSLLGLDGAPHQHARSAMNGPFVPRGLVASRIGPIMAEMIQARIRGWMRRREITILTETQELALDIIFRIMGIEDHDLSFWRAQYRDLLGIFANIKIKIPGSPAYRAAMARRRLDQRLREIIGEARRSNGERRGLIAALVHGRDETGQALSDQELLDNLRLLVLAGHETTASTMAWVLITLAARPELWEELGAEAQKTSTVPSTPQDLREYPMAEGLFREAVRLYAPVGVLSRKALPGLTIHDHPIPPGTVVGTSITLLLRDPSTYPDPERFDPGRWRGRTPTALETAAFGGGPHFCLGYHLAWMEVVQFSVALAREAARAGLRPRLPGGSIPRPVHVPLTRPPAKTKVLFN